MEGVEEFSWGNLGFLTGAPVTTGAKMWVWNSRAWPGWAWGSAALGAPDMTTVAGCFGEER